LQHFKNKKKGSKEIFENKGKKVSGMHSSMLCNKTNAKSKKLGVAQQITIGRNI